MFMRAHALQFFERVLLKAVKQHSHQREQLREEAEALRVAVGLPDRLDKAMGFEHLFGDDRHCALRYHVRARAQDRHIEQPGPLRGRSEEHTSELQSLMRISYAVFCLQKKKYRI